MKKKILTMLLMVVLMLSLVSALSLSTSATGSPSQKITEKVPTLEGVTLTKCNNNLDNYGYYVITDEDGHPLSCVAGSVAGTLKAGTEQITTATTEIKTEYVWRFGALGKQVYVPYDDPDARLYVDTTTGNLSVSTESFSIVSRFYKCLQTYGLDSDGTTILESTMYVSMVDGAFTGINGEDESLKIYRVNIPSGVVGTCPWSIENKTLTIEAGTLPNGSGSSKEMNWPWYYDTNITKVVIKEGVIAGDSLRGMFSCLSGVTEIEGLANLDTANATNMAEMFDCCGALSELDLSKFNTANVTDMESMFRACTALGTLDLSSFDTANVTNMNNMFNRCDALSELDLSSFNTENVTNMSYMFNQCSTLAKLDLSNFNTENVTDMSRMFNQSGTLATINLSSFNTEKVEDMTNMFYKCVALETLDLSSFDTANVKKMGSMFSTCSKLTTLDLSNFDTANVESMSSMFSTCSKLSTINLSSFDTANVENMYGMFKDCTELVTLDLSSFNTEKVENMNYMFQGDNKLTTIYVGSGWSTVGIKGIKEVKNGEGLFEGCSLLKGGAGTTCNGTNNIDGTYARIDGTGNPGYLTGKYFVTFDANGGTGTMDAQAFIQGSEQALTTNVFTKSGFNFSEWKADGGAFYADGEKITISDDIKLNAVWTPAKDTPAVGDITFTAPSNLVYDGSAKKATVTGKDGMGKISWVYSTDITSEDWSNEAPVNPGTYYVKVIIAEGESYSAKELTDESWKFTIAVAKVGEKFYASVQEAITDAKTTPITIIMIADSDKGFTVDAGQDITIDLNDHVINGYFNQNIANFGTLTILNNGTSQELRYWKPDASGLWQIQKQQPAGTLNVDYFTTSSACITGMTGYQESINKLGGIYNAGILIVKKVNLVGNYTDMGSAIHNTDTGTLTVEDCYVLGNVASCVCGGISNRGTATIKNTVISYNKADEVGGIFSKGDLTLDDVRITDNISENTDSDPDDDKYPSAGVYSYKGTVTLKNTVRIVGNKSYGNHANMVIARDVVLNVRGLGTESEIGISKLNENDEPVTGAVTSTYTSEIAECLFSDSADYDIKIVAAHLEILSGVAIVVVDGTPKGFWSIQEAVKAAIDNAIDGVATVTLTGCQLDDTIVIKDTNVKVVIDLGDAVVKAVASKTPLIVENAEAELTNGTFAFDEKILVNKDALLSCNVSTNNSQGTTQDIISNGIVIRNGKVLTYPGAIDQQSSAGDIFGLDAAIYDDTTNGTVKFYFAKKAGTGDTPLVKVEGLGDVAYVEATETTQGSGIYTAQIELSTPEQLGNEITFTVVVSDGNGGYTNISESKSLGIIGVTENPASDLVYDGQAHDLGSVTVNVDNCTISYNLNGSEYSATISQATNAGTYSFGYKVEKDGYATIAMTIEVAIAKRPVTVTTNSDSKKYDGDPLTNSTVTVSGDGFINGEINKISVIGSQTEIGESENTVTYTWNPGFTAGNYDITENFGTLTIIPDVITVTPNPATEQLVYDGSAHALGTVSADLDGCTITYKVNDGAYSATAPEATDAGTYEVSYKVEKDNYDTVEDTFTVVIAQKEVTVTADDASKTYGKEDPTFTATVVGTLGDDTVVYTFTRETGESAGTYDITPTGDESQGNYAVTFENGTLTISQKVVNVRANDQVSALGQPLVALTYIADKLEGDDKYSGSLTTCADKDRIASFTIEQGTLTAGPNYIISFTKGMYTVARATTPRAVEFVFTAPTDLIYNASSKTATVTVADGVKGMGKITVLYASSASLDEWTTTAPVNAGTYYVKVVVAEGTSYDSAELRDGSWTFTIEKKLLTVTGTTVADKVYDGTKNAVATAGTISGIIGHDEVSAIATGIFTDANAGKGKEVTISYTLTGKDSANYTIANSTASAEIKQKNLTVTGTTVADKVYDGTKNAVATAGTISGIIGHDEVSAIANGIFTDANAGKGKEVTISYTLTGKDSANYTIANGTASAEIKQKNVTVKANNASKTYGENDPAFTATVNGIVGEDTIAYTFTRAEGKNVGSYDIIVKGDAEQGNYAVTFEKGTLTINRKTIAVIADNRSSLTGTDLVELTYTGDKLCDGDSFSGALTTSADKSKAGTYDIELGTLTAGDNYIISFTKGTYTVGGKTEPRANDFTFTAPKDLTYDGNAKIPTAVLNGSVTGMGTFTLMYATSLTSAEWTATAPVNAGTYYVKVVVAEGTLYTEKELTDESWKFTIAQKAVTVTAKDASKEYGEKDPTFNAEVKGTIGTDTIQYTVSRAKGESAGAYTITPAGEASQGNYTVTYVAGAFVINSAKNATVTTDTDSLTEVQKEYLKKNAGKDVTVGMQVQETTNADDVAKIQAKAGSKTLVSYDTSLVVTVDGKEVSDAGSTNKTLIITTYQFDFANKTGIQVFRVHEGTVDELTETSNADGEYVKFDREAGTITVTACKYSTYSFAYSDASAEPAEEEKSVQVWVYILIAVAVLGVGAGAFFVVRKKMNG